MSNLTETEQWETGIYRIEEDDWAIGGENGIANKQAKQLGNRTKYLKHNLENAQNDINSVKGQGGFVKVHDFGDPQDTSLYPTPADFQTALTNYALGEIGITDQLEIFNGTKVTNSWNNHIWQLTNTQNTDPVIFDWDDIGDLSIAIAQHGSPGIVAPGEQISVDPLTGEMKISADLSGALKELSGYTSTDDDVAVTSTENVDIQTGGLLTIDGVYVEEGDLVLLKDQTDKTENGIYEVHEDGAWERAEGFEHEGAADAADTSFTKKLILAVDGDTNYAKIFFITNKSYVIDTDELIFEESIFANTENIPNKVLMYNRDGGTNPVPKIKDYPVLNHIEKIGTIDPRYAMASARVGEFIYGFGGTDLSSIIGFRINADKTLTPLTGLPIMAQVSHGIDGVSLRDYIYTVVGAPFGNKIEGFKVNSETGALTPLTGLPTPPTSGYIRSIFSYGNFLFIAGGNNISTAFHTYQCNPDTGALTLLDISQPAVNITSKYNIPFIGKYAYMFGDNNGNVYGTSNEIGCLCINPETGQFTRVSGMPTLPIAVYSTNCFVVGSYIYCTIVGTKDIFCYKANARTGELVKVQLGIELPIANSYGAAVGTLNGVAYIMGGYQDSSIYMLSHITE